MDLDVSIAVFCQNEAPRIAACIAGIAAAAESLRVGVTVIVNGSTDGSAKLALQTARRHGLATRIFSISYADKSHAIDLSFGHLREAAAVHVFVDGYAVMGPDALTALSAALASNPHAMAAAGVPANGRSMAATIAGTLRHDGQLNGQLYALRPDFIDRITQTGLVLPVGLYRGDGLIGSMACHDLDPRSNPWDGHRIQGVAQATYEIAPLSPLRPADIARQLRRKVRQMRGRLESAAITSIIYDRGYAALPAFADDMIAAWLAGGGRPQAALAERPFMGLALRQHARAHRPDEAALRPVQFGSGA